MTSSWVRTAAMAKSWPRGLAAIRALEPDRLLAIMEDYMGGSALRVVESLDDFADIRALARSWLVYSAYAEIFARATGFNKGMGGSMHTFFPPFGIMPNNAIVGGSADIALGMALFKRINRKRGIVIANLGDSSVASGPTWEALNFAAMDQYHTLWDADLGGAPPILFNFMNNFYGMGGQPQGETLGHGAPGAGWAWASMPRRCTASGLTATIPWPWPTPRGGRRRCCWPGTVPPCLM